MTETTQTIKETIELIIPYLDKLSEKLGTTAKQLWALQVRQAYAEIVKYLVLYAIIAVCLYGIYKFWQWMFAVIEEDTSYGSTRKYRRANENEGVVLFGGLAALSFILICGVYLFGSLGEFVTLIVNPDYWALNKLLMLIKGARVF